MFLSDISIRRPVLAVMATAALMIFGFIALGRLPVREMPKIDFPVATVTVVYPGASPEVVEKDVTDVLEEQINTVEGIRSIQSATTTGGSVITIQFELERDINVAAQEVRDKIAEIRPELPPTIEEPLIAKFDLDAQAVLWIGITATDRDRVELTEYTDKFIIPALEKIKGVGKIHVGGGQEYAVRIWLDADRLASRGLTVAEVARALRTQNAEIPSGRIEGVAREFTVKTEGELTTVRAFEELFLAYRKGKPVYLRDVARIEPGGRHERTIARLGRPPHSLGVGVVGLGILRQSAANTVDLARRVRETLAELEQDLPPGFSASILFDASVFIERSVDEVREALVLGGALTVVVIFVFLASGRSTLIAAVAIPTSIVSTYALLYFLGFTINNLTMLALVLAVGVVIDDAVVVLENIFRHLEMGKSRVEAARQGASEIAFAALAATLAIAVVFLPLAFVTGMVGVLFKEFAITVAAAVMVSLFVALTLIPMLCSRFLKAPATEGGGGRFFQFTDGMFQRLAQVYARTLEAALRLRWAVVLVAVLLLLASGVIFARLGKELTPEVDDSTIFISMRGPQGATLEFTDEALRELEDMVNRTPEVASVFTAIGLGFVGTLQGQVNEAVGIVRLRPLEERRAQGLRGQSEIMADFRRKFATIPGFVALVTPRPTVASTSQSAPLQLVIMGPEIGELFDVAERMKQEVAALPGLVDVDTNFDINKPKLRVVPNRAKSADLGVPLTEVAETLRLLLGGDDVTEFKRGGERYDVVVQLDALSRQLPKHISSLYVRTRGGRLVPLSALVEVGETVGPSVIQRYNQARSVTLEANLQGLSLSQALTQVDEIAARVLPSHFQTTLTGVSEDLEESFDSLRFTFILAIAIIYMLLASQFNHFIHPLTIMLALPLALFGAVGALYLLGLTVNLFSIIGIIMLTGLVTKNSILLVDYANQRRERAGEGTVDAMLQAGRVRLRPILMTALSTILGVLPALVGLGSGAESRQPLAAAVVGGMLTSTLLTLIVVPVVYTLIDDLGRRLRSVFTRQMPHTVTQPSPR